MYFIPPQQTNIHAAHDRHEITAGLRKRSIGCATSFRRRSGIRPTREDRADVGIVVLTITIAVIAAHRGLGVGSRGQVIEGGHRFKGQGRAPGRCVVGKGSI